MLKERSPRLREIGVRSLVAKDISLYFWVVSRSNARQQVWVSIMGPRRNVPCRSRCGTLKNRHWLWVPSIGHLIALINLFGGFSQWLQNRSWYARASNQIAPSKQHENNMTGMSQIYFKRCTASSRLIKTILFDILGILYTNNIFSAE